jgi:hypothetical protein
MPRSSHPELDSFYTREDLYQDSGEGEHGFAFALLEAESVFSGGFWNRSTTRGDVEAETKWLDEEAPPTVSEDVRFAQQVLITAEEVQLLPNGEFDKATAAAVSKFRKKYRLGNGKELTTGTLLALAQRALEVLGSPKFAQLGVRDANLDASLLAFKAAQGLGGGKELDAETKGALVRELVSRASTSHEPDGYLGGRIWTFAARSLPLRVAVYCSGSALGKREVEVLLFAHGLIHPCPRLTSVPRGFITDVPFQLGSVVAATRRPLVLVVPHLDWNNPGGEQGWSSRKKWHALAKPELLNQVLREVVTEIGRVQTGLDVSLTRLIIAGHSRAYDFLEPLAHSHADPEMDRGALAKLSEVWAFDSTYAGNVKNWLAWTRRKQGLRVSVYYRPQGGTEKIGRMFRANRRSGVLEVFEVPDGHCEMPKKRLAELLQVSPTVLKEAEGGELLESETDVAGDQLQREREEPPWSGQYDEVEDSANDTLGEDVLYADESRDAPEHESSEWERLIHAAPILGTNEVMAESADGLGFVPVPVEEPGGGRIVNKRDPAPQDLVEEPIGLQRKPVSLHRLAYSAWAALVKSARSDGIKEPLLRVTSGYRSSKTQERLFRQAVQKYGSETRAAKWVARPGGSPHQSGRAIDFYLGAANTSGNAAKLRRTPAYAWLEANARRFGFYPYDPEPWHWEYNPPSQLNEYEEDLDGFSFSESFEDLMQVTGATSEREFPGCDCT